MVFKHMHFGGTSSSKKPPKFLPIGDVMVKWGQSVKDAYAKYEGVQQSGWQKMKWKSPKLYWSLKGLDWSSMFIPIGAISKSPKAAARIYRSRSWINRLLEAKKLKNIERSLTRARKEKNAYQKFKELLRLRSIKRIKQVKKESSVIKSGKPIKESFFGKFVKKPGTTPRIIKPAKKLSKWEKVKKAGSMGVTGLFVASFIPDLYSWLSGKKQEPVSPATYQPIDTEEFSFEEPSYDLYGTGGGYDGGGYSFGMPTEDIYDFPPLDLPALPEPEDFPQPPGEPEFPYDPFSDLSGGIGGDSGSGSGFFGSSGGGSFLLPIIAVITIGGILLYVLKGKSKRFVKK